jgi:hypothetical protein
MAHNATVSALATQVYVPPASGIPNAVLFNNGRNTLYLGGSAVTASTGLPLGPNQSINMARFFTGIWAVCGNGTLGTATTLSSDAASGTNSTFMVSTAGFGTASTLQLGAGNNAETVSIATITGTAVTFTANTLFGHLSGEAVSLVSSPLGSTLYINRGTE